jgi:hypothetical protein
MQVPEALLRHLVLVRRTFERNKIIMATILVVIDVRAAFHTVSFSKRDEWGVKINNRT